MSSITKYQHDMSSAATYDATMQPLNYQHLLVFSIVAREGGLVPAGRVLNLSHPTLSVQIHALERQLGVKLFTKVGRRLVLTEAGRQAQRLASEIFAMGDDLVESVRGLGTGRPLRLEVGVVDVMPKLVARRLLQPALALDEPVRLVCREGSLERLLGDLARNTLDLVLADSPLPSGSPVRAHSHLLGSCGVRILAAPGLARRYRDGFPGSLAEAPWLLPAERLTLRRSLDRWFEQHGIRARIVAEFEDIALMQAFGADGVGIFAAPDAIETEVVSRYGVERIGTAEGVVEQYHAITAERRVENPAARAISLGGF